jgi:hypothetical protein
MHVVRHRIVRQPKHGINYFYFNISDKSHQKLLEQARKFNPLGSLEQITKIDEY